MIEVSFDGGMYYIGLMILVGILFWIFKHSNFFVWSKIEMGILTKVAIESLYKVQRFSTEWHVNTFAGANVTKIKRGMRGLQWFVNGLFYNLLPIIIVITGIIISVIIKNTALGIAIFILSIIYASISIFMAIKFNMPLAREDNKADTKVGATLADIISCNNTVKSFGNEKFEDSHFKSVINNFEIAFFKSWKSFEITHVIQNTIMTTFKATFLFGSFYLWYKGTFSIGDFSYSIASYHLISGYLRNIGENIRKLYTNAGEMEDVMKFDLRKFDVKDVKGAKELKVKKGEIEFKEITFKYERQKEAAFKNFSLKIKAGEKIAFVGHSGNGKTTITKLIQRLYDIQTGEIKIDGQDIAKITLESLRKNIVLVPQDPILFHRSLADNIAYGNLDASIKEIENAARLAHAHEFISNLPHQYSTLVGERGIKLSGGERQRIAIARAILANKKILILDEATSSLDSQSEKYIQDSIKELLKNKTAIIIAHRLSTIRHVDRIIVLEKGEIIEEGNHESLLKKKNGSYRNLWEIQSNGFIA